MIREVSSTEDVLRMIHWINSSEASVVRHLAEQARRIPLQQGESLARRGTGLHNLVLVSDGDIELSITGRSGKRHVVSHARRGQHFGLIAVMDGGPIIHDADAMVSSEVILIPRDALLVGMHQSPTLTMGLIKALCARSRRIYDFMADQSLLSMTARVARLVLSLFSSDPVANPSRTAIHLSQNNLSDMLGVSRQSLNIELKRLERMKLIRMAYARIDIIDAAGLETLIAQEV